MKTTMRLFLLLCTVFMASQPVLAQNDEDTRNKVVIITDDGDRQLITDEISVIRFEGPKVTVVQPWGETVFDRTLRSLTFLRPLPGTLRLTVNLNTDEDAGSTRGHSIDGNGYLASTWSENDRVYVYADAATTTSLGTLKPATTGGQVSKMTGDITATNLTNGQKLYLSTQPRTHIFASQTGDVEDAAMFYLTAESTVTINGGNATTANATFQMAQAVLKVTLKDGSNNDVSVKSLVITGSTETITVTPTSATNILYVALPAKASTNYSFTATDNNNREWTGSKTAALDNGKYYRTTVTMTKTMLNPSVTAPTAVTSALTYSGSAQKLFNIGSTSGGTLMYKVTTSNSKPTSTNGFKTTIDQGTNVGTYYLWYYVEGDEDYYGTGINTMGISKTISPASASVTAPTAVTGDLTYSGSTQTLFNAGSSSDGTLRYKVTTENTKPTSKTDFKTTIDQGTNAGTYYLWYYVVGNANHNDTEINTTVISKTIAKATATKTDPVAKTDLEYTGNAQALATGGSSEHGTFIYCATSDGEYTTTIPTGTDCGTDYAVYWKFTGDANHNDDSGSLTGITIAKVAASVTILPAAVTGDLTYSGSAQTLFSAGTSSDGTLMYKVTTTSDMPTSTEGFSAFDESISQRANAGTYYLWYYVDGDTNHNDTEINAAGISKAIAKKLLTVTANAQSRSYGQANPTLTYTHGDLATGDNESSVFSGELTCAATTTSEPGEYDITQGTLSAGDNYEISYTGAKLTVNSLDMSSGVTVTPYSAAYDGNAHGITIALSGAAEGATITYCDTENDTYRAENYTYSDVASARTVWYKIEKEHYTTITGSSTVTITQASNSFTTQPTITGWTYGSAANAPTGGVVEYGEIVYKYCATADGTYDTYANVVNGQAGTWYVKGFVEVTTNYAAATSDAISFTISAAAGSINYTTTEVEKTLAAPAFTNSLTKVGDGTVAYARSAGNNICTVNATTGEVTLNGTPGTCTITATVTNSTSYTYATNTASYTLTVLPVLDLSLVTANTTVPDGVTVTGTLGGNYKISIVDGAIVTLDNVTINRGSSSSWQWAGLNCIGDATIILADGTTNTVKGFYEYYPGIHIPSNKTLTIQGTGTLDASSNGKGAAIGGGWNIDCGNIIINGGTITATGGYYAAGIGCGGTSSGNPSCGDITINGGTVTAIGGTRGAGIGCTFTNGTCGDILISGGTVTATGGSGSGSGSYGGAAGIGGGSYNGNCGNIIISGGEVTATGGGGSGNSGGAAGIGGGYSSSCGDITISGGTVTANGGYNGVGIGGGYNKPCGDILINGGTVEATAGGSYSAGIGAGYFSSNGNITIENTVTRVTSTKGANAYNNIGISYQYRGSCGTVTIGGVTGAISTSPYTYEPPKTLSAATAEDVGKVIGANGKVYATVSAATEAGTTASAIIAYVGSAGSVDASSATYKGLAIALTDANNGSKCQWYTANSGTCVSQNSIISTAITYMNGIACTETLVNSNGSGVTTNCSGHTHAAATAASSYSTARPSGTSAWSLPSMGQWNLIVQGLATKKAGSAVTTNLTQSPNDTYVASNLNSVITDAGGTGLQSDNYWSSTECSAGGIVWFVSFNGGGAANHYKSNNYYVRSVLAF